MGKEKDVVLFVNAIRPQTMAALEEYESKSKRHFTPVIIVDEKIKDTIYERNHQNKIPDSIERIIADFDSPKSVRKALKPYMDRILTVTSQYENSVHELRKLIPYLPQLTLPTEKSLEWATEKKLMRELLESHDPQLVPKYKEVSDSHKATLDAIEKHMSYPLIVKPSGLEGSLLVSRVENREELKDTLNRTLKAIQATYDKWIKRHKTRVLVEEFMEGMMYSVDVYVAQDGTCRPTPPARVLTGRNIGYDDFFGYMHHAPADLNDTDAADAQATAEKACHALGLRSVLAHVEVMHTPSGWKVVELGPRIGGYRHDIYNAAYGINHIVNDILNRAGEEPIIPDVVTAHSAWFEIYPRQEGTIASIDGLEVVKQLPSFSDMSQSADVGDEARFAKHSGDPVFLIYLYHKDKDQFDADIKTMENTLIINIVPLQK